MSCATTTIILSVILGISVTINIAQSATQVITNKNFAKKIKRLVDISNENDQALKELRETVHNTEIVAEESITQSLRCENKSHLLQV